VRQAWQAPRAHAQQVAPRRRGHDDVWREPGAGEALIEMAAPGAITCWDRQIYREESCG